MAVDTIEFSKRLARESCVEWRNGNESQAYTLELSSLRIKLAAEKQIYLDTEVPVISYPSRPIESELKFTPR